MKQTAAVSAWKFLTRPRRSYIGSQPVDNSILELLVYLLIAASGVATLVHYFPNLH